ncbi:unnamed protein product [Urochloa decumbens]|uniref:Uncharacterized protein n=1 Tax=Urochloa decumbens TaxID=240449 RepID=A0ABC9FXJ0_9POAL
MLVLVILQEDMPVIYSDQLQQTSVTCRAHSGSDLDLFGIAVLYISIRVRHGRLALFNTKASLSLLKLHHHIGGFQVTSAIWVSAFTCWYMRLDLGEGSDNRNYILMA